MHQTAMANGEIFFKTYVSQIPSETIKLIEIGSQNVNGSLRSVAPSYIEYIGVDFVEGDGVDVILDDPYSLPFESNSADVIISSSCFEHSEMFWLVFLEVLRVLKPHGLLYLNVPSNGQIHRFPVDCWRFYPDSGHALVTWAKHNGINARLLESYVSYQTVVIEDIAMGDTWNDFIGVFVKDDDHSSHYQARVLDSKKDVYNASVYVNGGYQSLQVTHLPQEEIKMRIIQNTWTNQLKIL